MKNIGFLINKHNFSLFEGIFCKSENLWIEIGSGNGEFVTEIAKREKDSLFIACEIKFKRIFKTLKKIKRADLNNVLVAHCAGDIFTEYFIHDNTVNNFIINFPDPWFKKRHKKRRLINPHFYKIMWQKLKYSGKICIATDYREYAEIILEEAANLKLFENTCFTEKWLYKDIFTKFEKNFIAENKEIFYIELKKAE